MPPVVTVTFNPAVDLTVVVPGLRIGEVHRAESAQFNPGGKGVNVAGCLADWGVPVTATGVLGADNQAAFQAFFAAKGIADRFVRVPGETRTNIKIADPRGNQTTDVNLPGPNVDRAALARVNEVLAETVEPGAVVVVAGSLPAGLPEDTLGSLAAWLRRRGARVVLDSSGAPLAAALAMGGDALPCCVKPNRDELEEWAGRALPGAADVLDAARRLQARGIDLVVVSLGADGALFVTGERALQGRLPPVRALSTVGAGDAMVAGLAAALRDGASLGETARLGLAFAAAKLGRIGPHLPDTRTVRDFAEAATLSELPSFR